MKTFIKTYKLTRPEGVAPSDYETYLLILQSQVERLAAEGWSERAIRKGYIRLLNDSLSRQRPLQLQLEEAFASLHRFGSRFFKAMWKQEARRGNSPAQDQRLLRLALDYVRMPDELSGDSAETADLLTGFSRHLPPDDRFWADFSRVVRQAYPKDTLSDKQGDQGLKRRVHQFRYLISAQQAQWVRNHYRRTGLTDAQALARYLSTKDAKDRLLEKLLLNPSDYDTKVSSRLHNKLAVGEDGEVLYPGGVPQINFKVLMDFHTEFILSDKGDFLNELDPEGTSPAGIINGASFNYAGPLMTAHKELDVRPVKSYDPAFRNQAVANGGLKFCNPDRPAYTNPADKIYGDGHRCLEERVRQASQSFERLIRRSGNWV